MDLLTCYSCQTPSPANAKFCGECGSLLYCKNCQTALTKGAKFCIECGADVKKATSINDQRNILSFHRKGDEVSCEVSVSDEVGREGFKTLVQSLSQGTMSTQYVLPTSKPDTDDVVYDLSNEQESKHIPADVKPKVDDKDDSKPKQHPAAQKNFPHIDDLLRRKKFTETEWVLVFAFYESEFGDNTFTKEKIRQAYADKRKNDSRMKNFSANWAALRTQFFNTATKDVFIIDYDKLSSIAGLIEGTEQNITAGLFKNKKPKADSQTKSDISSNFHKSPSSAKNIAIEEFDIVSIGDKQSLSELYANFTPNNNKLIFGMVAYYIIILNKSEVFTAGNIDYAYRILKIPRKNNLVQLINNVKNDTQWFEGAGSGVWKLNRYGEVELEKIFGR